MVDVAIYGATGYTALELIRILIRHPHARITAVTSRQDVGKPLHAVHQSLFGRLDLDFEELTPAELASRAEVVFCCVPHGASMAAVPELLSNGAKVIDLSADYRLSDPGVFEQWYKLVHTDPTRLGETVYGLPELFGDRIPGRDLIANPGCYTSTAILALAPLLAGSLIEPTGIVIDAKSGVSGAGRAPKLGTLYSECNENFAAYAVGTHRHQPEIEQVLSQVSGKAVEVLFTPHLVPMDRGIFATIYASPIGSPSQPDLLDAMRRFYEGKPFVRIVDHLPQTKDVAFTNFCDVTVCVAKGRVMILAVLDNLIKGAAGVAVQNFNLMCGFDETTGLV
ncbi:MAG: N-acetyl-gamma-glutamyl-phosphate reductase [Planctomycetota bacterium]|nr:N-acetyl-gamma-glutamyl-phosphate reductase [Planctomycetaceae bacterium]MDQ3332835.1 N-acetyl-gamma-glutamyl-phosphate reductase [Planctomycetota bacterium]